MTSRGPTHDPKFVDLFDTPNGYGTTGQVLQSGPGGLVWGSGGGGGSGTIDFDETPTQNSTKAVHSGGVFNALAIKQPMVGDGLVNLVPTVNSARLVISGGVASALATKQPLVGDGQVDNQPVQNSARLISSGAVSDVVGVLHQKHPLTSVDASPTGPITNSNLVTSGGVHDLVEKKLPKPTIQGSDVTQYVLRSSNAGGTATEWDAVDSTPLPSSTNLVRSGGVATAIGINAMIKVNKPTSLPGDVTDYVLKSTNAGGTTTEWLGVDSTPRINGTNLVASGGVATALEGVAPNTSTAFGTDATTADQGFGKDEVIRTTANGSHVNLNIGHTDSLFGGLNQLPNDAQRVVHGSVLASDTLRVGCARPNNKAVIDFHYNNAYFQGLNAAGAATALITMPADANGPLAIRSVDGRDIQIQINGTHYMQFSEGTFNGIKLVATDANRTPVAKLELDSSGATKMLLPAASATAAAGHQDGTVLYDSTTGQLSYVS